MLELDLFDLAGRNVVPSDLQYLTDENIEEIGALLPHHQPALQLTLAHCTNITGGAMTHVEKMRFQAALQALRGTNSILLPCLPSTALTSTLPQRRAKQRRRGPSECLRAARVRREERMDNQRNAFPTEAPIRASTRALTHARVPLLRLSLVPPWRQLLRLLLRLLVLPGSRGLLLRLRLLPALREDLLRDLLLLRHHPRLPRTHVQIQNLSSTCARSAPT